MDSSNNLENNVNAIRIELYEEIKDMSISELNRYVKMQVANLYQEHGICTVNESNVNNEKVA